MKTIQFNFMSSILFIALLFSLSSKDAFSQDTKTNDSLKSVKADTLNAVKVAPAVIPAVVPVEAPAVTPAEPQKADEEKPDGDKKDKKGKKNEIIFYGGANFTQLGSSSGNYETESDVGYQLGANYKQGRMFYWQAGARFANAMIGYKPADSTDFGSVSLSDVDFPLTLGVNFTSFMNRVLSVRLFVSAVPSFTLKVGDNDYGITKDKVNSFILYGQGGLGVNVAFLVIEAGYNFGFNEMLVDYSDSKPGQVFVNLGFRF